MDAFDRITTGNAARLLFCNPVCGLITTNPDGSHNGMTISWLTPADNHAAFILSLNARRHSRANLARDALFSLSVGVEGMEELLLALGGETGAVGPDMAVSAAVVADAPGVTPAGAPAAPDKLTRLGSSRGSALLSLLPCLPRSSRMYQRSARAPMMRCSVLRARCLRLLRRLRALCAACAASS
jgi:flavin reductase (DIM6/NTAB) family NADH-FMN oxidoreductase RutF